ncbi:MAG: hypothetical protein DMG23_12215 [Acidobacteria bacterium]|nr:MAG: hypothetical protein DMG23_12215 [Acidobacteriota bacterium]
MPRDAVFNHVYAVIMAGGSGTRFWPLSRRKQPKQLLELYGRGTLLEQTVARLKGFISPARTYVLTSRLVRDEVCRRLPMVPRAQIVAEPVGGLPPRGTPLSWGSSPRDPKQDLGTCVWDGSRRGGAARRFTGYRSLRKSRRSTSLAAMLRRVATFGMAECLFGELRR